jgi:hypothetical protein
MPPPWRSHVATMKRLKSLLGKFQTSPTWLRACLAIPFAAAVAILLIMAGQSRVLAILPNSATNSAYPNPVTSPTPAPNVEKSPESVVLHGSLSGNPRRPGDLDHIIAPQ